MHLAAAFPVVEHLMAVGIDFRVHVFVGSEREFRDLEPGRCAGSGWLSFLGLPAFCIVQLVL